MIFKKIKKLFKDPKSFYLDFIENGKNIKYIKNSSKESINIIFAFHFSKWKRDFIRRIFPKSYIVFISKNSGLKKYFNYLGNKKCEFIVWGMNIPKEAEEYVNRFNIKVIYIEDGFVRSIGLGANHVLPYSICLDESTLYFNSRQSSDLENLLENNDFLNDRFLMNEAKECLRLIIENKITKYNLEETNLANKLYGEKKRKRILVIGQVEDDQSIIYGCDEPIDNNKLVRLAAKENPDSQIIYKVHPDVIAKKRKELTNPAEVAHLATLITEPMTLDDALVGVDKVYTISSLAGFESLLRGVPVVTLGCPFYAGWGLTDTRQVNLRRKRRLSLLEVFAGAYLVYPKYIDPETGEPSTLKRTIEKIVNSRKI